jgi:hypothetical protein
VWRKVFLAVVAGITLKFGENGWLGKGKRGRIFQEADPCKVESQWWAYQKEIWKQMSDNLGKASQGHVFEAIASAFCQKYQR